MLFKKAMKGEIDVMGPAMAVGKELVSVPSFESVDMSAPMAEERAIIRSLKKAILMTAGKAAETFGPKLNDEQEILMNIADMVIELYVAESTILRTEKLIRQTGEAANELYINMARVYLHYAINKIKMAGDEAVACFASGDELKVLLMGMKRFTKANPINTRDLRRSIADVMVEKNKFPYELYK